MIAEDDGGRRFVAFYYILLCFGCSGDRVGGKIFAGPRVSCHKINVEIKLTAVFRKFRRAHARRLLA